MVINMSTVSSGRAPKNTAPGEQKKKKKRLAAADVTAVICAVLCAGCLILWGNKNSGGADDAIIPVSITYTEPSTPAEKGFWDYFSEAIASAFGYNG